MDKEALKVEVNVSTDIPTEFKSTWCSASHEGTDMEISIGLQSSNLHFYIGDESYCVDVAELATKLYEMK